MSDIARIKPSALYSHGVTRRGARDSSSRGYEKSTVSSRSPRRLGLTLVELLMALAITGLIGAAIASMLTAVSYGTSGSRDLRSLVVKNKTLSARITASIRQSAQVLDAADGYIVLWVKDLNASGEPDLLELKRIELDAVARELTAYTPDPLAVNAAYLLTDDFDTITNALIVSGDLVGELWATGVAQWAVSVDAVDPMDAALVSFQLTLSAGSLTDTSVNAVSLRD